MDNVARHEEVCQFLTALYAKKNADYGDSFHNTYLRYGMAMPLIRLEDKLNRLQSLYAKGTAQVQDESIRDTLVDLANYAIMTVMELDRAEETAGGKEA